jgi:hypothetical protein
MIVDRWCFKIDRTNAKAMISGFVNNNRRMHQAIWCDVMRKPFPMLITLNRSITRFPMSRIGYNLSSETYHIPLKYIAIMDSEYHIRNDMKLWEKICTNGLFDVWDPYAPYTRFSESKSDEKQYRIQLLRIYEIEEEFHHSDIRHVNNRIDHIRKENRAVTLKAPVIHDEEFGGIRSLLVGSIAAFMAPHVSFRRS